MAWPLLEYHTTNSGGYRNEKSAKKESSNKKIKLKNVIKIGQNNFLPLFPGQDLVTDDLH